MYSLSPLLFDIAIEVLANVIRGNTSIHGVKCLDHEFKISLYAVDVVLFLQSPCASMKTVSIVLEEYLEVSGYKINQKKSSIMRFNIHGDLRSELQMLYKVPWTQNGTSYLGIKVSDNSRDLVLKNVLPIKNIMRNKMEQWKKLNLSGWGRLATIKMGILPLLLFLFQNLIVSIPVKYLNKLQGILNAFLWDNAFSLVKSKLLQQRTVKGGISYPSIMKYYQTSRLATMLTWWNQEERSAWVIKQYGIPVPLKE